GLCVVHDPAAGKAEIFDFLAGAAKRHGAYAVPGNVSGFSFLQSSYGRLPWAQVISPAERAAAAGFPISQALSTRLASTQDYIRLDAGLSAEFLDESGHVKPAGSIVVAPELADTLSKIRTEGAAVFYRGDIASELIAYTNTGSNGFSTDDLAAYSPRRITPNSVRMGDDTVFFPPTDLGAGKYAAALLSRLLDAEGHPAATNNLGGSVAAATKATMDASGVGSLPRDFGATGFASEDSNGMATACAVTMNGPFGSGHTASGTGIILAAAPNTDQSSQASTFLTPAIAANADKITSFAGAGAGGPNGTAAIALALLELTAGKDIAAPGALHSTGLAPYDTVNVIACQNGVCAALADPGAHGLGASGSP
ncbi:MAG TPA: gamma-glutamyltransferase, partial [Rhizomicrobium sp.]